MSVPPVYAGDDAHVPPAEADRLPVAVYGLGRIGLPVAVVMAAATGDVVGVDVDSAVVDRVNDGECPVERERGLPERVEAAVTAGRLRATTDAAAAAEYARAHVVVVPTTGSTDDHSSDGRTAGRRTPDERTSDDAVDETSHESADDDGRSATPDGQSAVPDDEPGSEVESGAGSAWDPSPPASGATTDRTATLGADLSAIEAVTESIAAGLHAGDAVFVESTVPPGTCRTIESTLATETSLDRSAFGVAACPERTSSGRALQDVQGAYPRVVGGTDPAGTRTAEQLYTHVTDAEIHPVADAATAATVKLFEGVYRDVNIALANELGRISEALGIDGRAAIAAANGQPYCEIHDPGPGVGGHCIPYYPSFLTTATATPSPLLETARAVNESMPIHTADRLLAGLDAAGVSPSTATALVLGVAYRPEVTGTTHTPTVPLVERLADCGVSVTVCDPHVPPADAPSMPARWVSLSEIARLDPDAVCVVTPHEAFDDVDWTAFDDPLLFDARDGLPSLDGAASVGDGTTDAAGDR